MANENIVLDIQLKADEALNTIRELQAQEQKLKETQAQLDRSTAEGQKEYIAYSEAIKMVKKQIQEQSKVLQNSVKDFKAAEGSMTQMKAQLANLTKQYNDLSKAEREGDVGKNIGEQISALTAELSKNEEALGNYRRNVGNYKSALEGLDPLQNTFVGKIMKMGETLPTAGAAFKSVGSAALGFGKQLLALCANPFIAVAVVIVGLVMKIVNAFKRNEAATMKMKEAFAILDPVINAIKRMFDFLADSIANVVSWIANFIGETSEAAKAAQELTKQENDLVKKKRQMQIDEAKHEKEVAELREKITAKDKYTNEERLAFIDELTKKEEAFADKKYQLAKEEFEIAKKRAEESANDAEANENLAEKEAELYKAKTALFNKQKEINSQRVEAINGIKAEQDAVKKAAMDKQLAKQAEEAQKAADALKAYQDQTKALVDALKGVKDLIVQNEQEQIQAIEDKYNQAIASTNDYVAEIESLSSKASLTEGEKERLAELEQLQFNAAQIQVRLEQQKQEEITAISQASAKKRVDDTISDLENQHSLALAKAKANGEDVANLEREQMEERAELLKTQLDNEALSQEERLALEVEYYSILGDMREQDVEAEQNALEAKKQKALEVINSVGAFAEQGMQIASAAVELANTKDQAELQQYEESQEKKKKALESRLNQGLISQEEYDKQVEAMDAEMEKKRAAMELKQAKREKAIAYAQAVIQMALGIATAVAQNPMMGGLPGSAIAATMGAIQIATIAATPLPKASRGALLEGASHAEGGIPIEAEGGEAIINKRSTARFRGLLSAINEWGGGVKFARGGIPLDGGYSSRSIENLTNTISRKDWNDMMNKPIYTTITDIRKEDARYSEVQSIKEL